MAKTKVRKAPVRAAASPLIPHILTLAQQTSEQFLHLALTVDTHVSLDSDIDPTSKAYSIETPTPSSNCAVLRRALHTEMRQQLKALAVTIDALHVCAEKAAAGLR